LTVELFSASEVAGLLNEKEQKIQIQAKQIESLSSKISWFEEQLKLLKHNKYAKSSEKQTSMQSGLFDEDENNLEVENKPAEKEAVTSEKNTTNRKPKHIDTSKLAREINIIDLSDDQKQCDCGQCLEKMGEERKKELVFIPASFKVIEHVRIKYTCRQCDSIKTPKAIDLPLSKSKAGAPLLTEVILNKYAYHLPFYRQSKLFTTSELSLSDSTLAGWAMRSAEALAPLGDALWKQLETSHVLQADETPVKILKPDKKAYMWLYHCYMPGKRFIIFDFDLSRGSAVVNERLQNYTGLLQTDGYAGYNTQRNREDIITLGCWDHARRKFADVVKAAGNNKSGKAGKVIEKIAKLYEIEKEITKLSISERKRIRQEKAKPKLEALRSFIGKINAPPKSLLATAVKYCKNQWQELVRYVEHGEAMISNCWIENQVRPFAVGKRNWLFVGNEKSAKNAALLYSLIQSCDLNDIEPRKYLTYVLSQVHAIRRKEIDPATLLPNTIDKSLLN
jgi:transposase